MTYYSYILRKNNNIIYKGEDYSEIERLVPRVREVHFDDVYDLTILKVFEKEAEIEYEFDVGRESLDDKIVSKDSTKMLLTYSSKEKLEESLDRVKDFMGNYVIGGILPRPSRN